VSPGYCAHPGLSGTGDHSGDVLYGVPLEPGKPGQGATLGVGERHAVQTVEQHRTEPGQTRPKAPAPRPMQVMASHARSRQADPVAGNERVLVSLRSTTPRRFVGHIPELMQERTQLGRIAHRYGAAFHEHGVSW
jgi:hypothetical protein